MSRLTNLKKALKSAFCCCESNVVIPKPTKNVGALNGITVREGYNPPKPKLAFMEVPQVTVTTEEWMEEDGAAENIGNIWNARTLSTSMFRKIDGVSSTTS